MSLWTPSGEHQVPRDGRSTPGAEESAGSTSPPGRSSDLPVDDFMDDEEALLADALLAVEGMPSEERHMLVETLASLGVEHPEHLSDHDLARHLLALNSLAASQQRLLQEPAAAHVANHLVGLHQLAALHLSQQVPALDEARLAIDAMTAALDKVGSRLGEAEPYLRQGLAQLQQMFVHATDGAGLNSDDQYGGDQRTYDQSGDDPGGS